MYTFENATKLTVYGCMRESVSVLRTCRWILCITWGYMYIHTYVYMYIHTYVYMYTFQKSS